jgi:hypothetical protein
MPDRINQISPFSEKSPKAPKKQNHIDELKWKRKNWEKPIFAIRENFSWRQYLMSEYLMSELAEQNY